MLSKGIVFFHLYENVSNVELIFFYKIGKLIPYLYMYINRLIADTLFMHEG